MHVVRLMIVVFLILAIMLAYSPLVNNEVSQLWEHARPGVILIMDDLYAAIRGFVVGTDANEGIQDGAPGVDFDRVITKIRGDRVEGIFAYAGARG